MTFTSRAGTTILLAFLIAALTGCGLSPDQETVIVLPSEALESNPGIGLTVIEPANRGAPLTITGNDLNGETVSLADFRGDVVVVNAWASWCAPCLAELPEFAEVASTIEGQGVSFVGLNVQDDPQSAQVLAVDLPYPSIEDPDGSILETIPNVPPRALPSTVILDRQGRVAVSIVGPVVLGTLQDTVLSVVASEDSS